MCLNPYRINYGSHSHIYAPCKKCFECRIAAAREWSFRIAKECRLYEKNCMITLTYNNESLPREDVAPWRPTLRRRDVQLFLKRLRKKIGKFRYFGCGEYGEKFSRPHMHIIIFGYDFPDKVFFCKDKKGSELYRSPLLESCWTAGFSSVCDVEFDTAKYVALYMQKPPDGQRQRPFTFMSLKPGIGADSVEEQALKSDKIYVNGQYIRNPKYFNIILERKGFYREVDDLKHRRIVRWLNKMPDYDEIYKKIKKIEKKFGKSLDENFMI